MLLVRLLLSSFAFIFCHAEEFTLPSKSVNSVINYHKPYKPKNSLAKNTNNTYTKSTDMSKTTVIVYMAGDNDLFPFAGRNLNQMEKIGSNENVNVFVHFDMHRPGYPKTTKHYVIEKGKRIQIGADSCMDSGDPKTLIHAVKLAVETCPANNYMLVLWNHGTGPIQPNIRKSVNPSYLFKYNEKTKLIELDRSIGFLDYLSKMNEEIEPTRGICFDDTTGNYLTDEKLKYALDVVTKEYIKGKFAIIGCDACLMSMVEIASLLKDYAHVMVGSQEVELGTGWDYASVLSAFINNKPEKHSLASHIVQAYSRAYNRITHDYTQSAIDLDGFSLLEQNFAQVTKLLIEAFQKQKGKTVKLAIKMSRSREHCTSFDEPTFLDLDHLYKNLINNINKFELNNSAETTHLRKQLKDSLTQGSKLIEQLVIDNVAGANKKLAKGISVYFPDEEVVNPDGTRQRFHSSYRKCEFAIRTQWLKFILLYNGLSI